MLKIGYLWIVVQLFFGYNEVFPMLEKLHLVLDRKKTPYSRNKKK